MVFAARTRRPAKVPLTSHPCSAQAQATETQCSLTFLPLGSFPGLSKPNPRLSQDLVINTLDGFYWNEAGPAHDLLFN